MSFGSNLKRLRRDKNLTQGDLAETSEVKVGHISKLECDNLDPKLSTIYKLMKGLDCNADMLLTDFNKTNMSSRLKAQFERAALLPEDRQRVLIDLIDTYCMVRHFQDFLKDGNKTSFHIMKGKTENMLPAENNN